MANYKRILVATDFSEASGKALTEAVRFARKHDAELHVVYVEVIALQGLGTFTDVPLPDYIRKVSQLGLGGDQNVTINYQKTVARVIRDASEAAGIVRYAREQGIDMIVLGTHGRSVIPELLLGSVAQAVVREAPCAVLVVGPGAGGLHTRCVLAPVDFSPQCRASLAAAARLAAEAGSRLVVMNVVDFSRVAHPEELDIGERERLAREELDRFIAQAGLEVPVEPLVTVGPGAGDILRIAAQCDAGLIVMAPSSHTGLQRLLLGSVCKAVVRAAPCPVLVHRETVARALERAAA